MVCNFGNDVTRRHTAQRQQMAYFVKGWLDHTYVLTLDEMVRPILSCFDIKNINHCVGAPLSNGGCIEHAPDRQTNLFISQSE